MDSPPMKWTPVGSHGLEVILKPLAMERIFHALERLQAGSHGSTQASIWQADHHPPGPYRQSCFYHFGGSAKWS